MPDRERPPPHIGDDGQPTTWSIWARLNDIDSDVRSVKQTVEKEIVPTLAEHKNDIRVLKNRWLYALTMIASAGGAAIYLAYNGPIG